jgi:hypothetical protein
MADARPVTDVVVERFIMVCFVVAFWRALIARDAIGAAWSLTCLRAGPGVACRAL